MTIDVICPKKVTCTVKLVGGEEVELLFRPFTLRDFAWIQQEFDTEEKRLQITEFKIEAVTKLIWNSLENESKALFQGVKFHDFDEETGKEFEVKVRGHEKLMHSIADQAELLKAFASFVEIKNFNDFVPDNSKKKIIQ